MSFRHKVVIGPEKFTVDGMELRVLEAKVVVTAGGKKEKDPK